MSRLEKVVSTASRTSLQLSLVSGGDVDRRGHRASVKRQVAPVARESRLKIDGPKEPAHLVGKILF